jgi:hypothetical protein
MDSKVEKETAMSRWVERPFGMWVRERNLESWAQHHQSDLLYSAGYDTQNASRIEFAYAKEPLAACIYHVLKHVMFKAMLRTSDRHGPPRLNRSAIYMQESCQNLSIARTLF